MTVLAPTPIESSSVTLERKLSRINSSQSQKCHIPPQPTACSEYPTLRIPKTQLCPTLPALRVSPLGAVRETSASWALSLSGEDTTAELRGGGAPLTDSSPHTPKGPRCHLPNTQTYR